jgi:signal transduction histidine kinase
VISGLLTLPRRVRDELRSTGPEAFVDFGSEANRRVIGLYAVVLCGSVALLVVAILPFARSRLDGAAIFPFASAFGLFLAWYFWRTPVPSMRVIDTVMLLTYGLCLVTHNVLGSWGDFVVFILLTQIVNTFTVRSVRAALVHFSLASAIYALALVIEPAGQPAPVARFAAFVITMATLSVTIGALTERARRIAVLERTSRRAIEADSIELAKVSRAKTRFLAGMSHELRTPLNAIIGFGDVLGRAMSGPLNPRQEQYVADIVDSGRHLLALIDDLLDLSAVETGRLALDVRNVDVRSVLDAGVTMVRERAARNGVEVAVDIGNGDAGSIVADERKLKQVVFNLLANAVKFTPSGGHVRVSATTDENGLEVAVCDTGPGIPADELDQIFEEYTQGSITSAEGTGLGLPMAKRLVELHGGSISVASTPELGSTFTFRLPAAPMPAAVESQALAPEHAAAAPSVGTAARLGGLFGLEISVVALVGALTVRAEGFDHERLTWLALAALMGSGILVLAARRVTMPVIYASGIVGIAGFTAAGHWTGPFRMFAPLALGAFCALTFALRGPKAGWTYTGVALLAYALLLATQSGNEAAAMQWLLLVAGSALIGGMCSWVIARTRDFAVAEQAARQEAERVATALAEVSRHKSSFLAGMSHELRTPLNAIIGFGEVLEREMFGPLNARQAQQVADIVESGRHLLSLINDILELAKAEAGRLELDRQPSDLRALVTNAAVAIGAQVELSGEAGGDVALDERRMSTVMTNLLSNAARHSRPGTPIVVTLSRTQGAVAVSVVDTGSGIEPGEDERIFEPFTHASAEPTQAKTGTGLGLALARRFVELHGGRLWVTSTPGAGATFTFTIPDGTAIATEAVDAAAAH